MDNIKKRLFFQGKNSILTLHIPPYDISPRYWVQKTLIIIHFDKWWHKSRLCIYGYEKRQKGSPPSLHGPETDWRKYLHTYTSFEIIQL